MAMAASSFFSWSSSSARVLPLKIKRRSVFIVNCNPKTDAEAESVTSNPSKSISTYKWISGIGGLGFAETAYLTYTKLTNSDAFCPASSVGGSGGCGDILSSDYALVFGVPLPLIGMVAYGFVATVGLQLAGKGLPFGVDENNGRLILLGSATAMASASACFLYILSTKFAGVTCQYCLFSALLSFSLFFTIVKDFGFEEIRKMAALQLSVAGLVIAALSTSYSSLPLSSSMAEMELQPFTTEITTQSSPVALSLAKHLHSIGAKIYGAFWCSHCVEQKEMFGHEAAKLLDYVECFPDGYRKGIKMAKACGAVDIEGFPTWVINGQVYSGELSFEELAQASGFNSEELQQSN